MTRDRMTEHLAALRTRASERSPALIIIGRLAFATVLLVLGLEIVRFALSDRLSDADPALSLVLDPTQSRARVAISHRLLVSNVAKIDEAIAGARVALSDNPLSPEALTLLAQASKQNREKDRTFQLMMLASRINSRDLRSQLWLLNQDLRDANVDSALARLDTLFRGQSPEVLDQLAPELPPILTREPYRSGYVKLLQTNPPWRSVWFVDLLRRSADLSGLDNLFAELQAGEQGPTEKELDVFLRRMTEAGMFDEAHDAWLRALPSDRGEDLLYNAQFHYPLTGLPFDWVIEPASNAKAEIATETENDTRVLNVQFLGGRVKFEHVSHLLNLEPGAYRFEGRERLQELQNERGLRWRIFCVGETTDTLGTTALANGEIAWREFGMDFIVPAGKCYYQKLVLELPAQTAPETEIRGRASYADLDLQMKSPPRDN
jgi:hypothetical protein